MRDDADKAQQQEALRWARRTQEAAIKKEAEILKARLGPNLFKFGEIPSVSPAEPGFWGVNEYVNPVEPPGTDSDAESQDFPGQAK